LIPDGWSWWFGRFCFGSGGGFCCAEGGEVLWYSLGLSVDLAAPTRFRWWFVALVMSDEVLVVRLPHWRWIC
jgi:hypothetical protein